MTSRLFRRRYGSRTPRGNPCPRCLSCARETLSRRKILRAAHRAGQAHKGLARAVRLGLFQLITHDLALRHAGPGRLFFAPGSEVSRETNSNRMTHLAKTVFACRGKRKRVVQRGSRLSLLADLRARPWRTCCRPARSPLARWPTAAGRRGSRRRDSIARGRRPRAGTPAPRRRDRRPAAAAFRRLGS